MHGLGRSWGGWFNQHQNAKEAERLEMQGLGGEGLYAIHGGFVLPQQPPQQLRAKRRDYVADGVHGAGKGTRGQGARVRGARRRERWQQGCEEASELAAGVLVGRRAGVCRTGSKEPRRRPAMLCLHPEPNAATLNPQTLNPKP